MSMIEWKERNQFYKDVKKKVSLKRNVIGDSNRTTEIVPSLTENISNVANIFIVVLEALFEKGIKSKVSGILSER